MNRDTAIAITAMVAKETGAQLEFSDFAEHNVISARTHRGGLAIIVCYRGPWTGTYIVRSLLKVKDRHRKFSWLINGQPCRNTKELARWGEHHVYELTPEQWTAEASEGFDPEKWCALLGKSFPVPRNTTVEEIKSIIASRQQSAC